MVRWGRLTAEQARRVGPSWISRAIGGGGRVLHEVAAVQFSDVAAREMVEEFILGNGESKLADWTALFDAQPA